MVPKQGSLCCTLAAPVVFVAAWLYYPVCEQGPVLCVWRHLFGASCLGCGLTRAMCFLVHGLIAEAYSFNRLVLPISLGLALLSFGNGVSVLRNWKCQHRSQ